MYFDESDIWNSAFSMKIEEIGWNNQTTKA